MRGRLTFAVLTLLVTAAAPLAQPPSLPLGDFGTISYPADEQPPNADRVAAVLVFVFDQFPHVDLPPTTIHVMTFEDYEYDMAQRFGGPNWRQWLVTFRQQSEWGTRARRLAGRERLIIHAFQNPSDDVVIHEALHFIFEVLEVEHPDDASLLNFEQTVVQAVAATEVSRRYRQFLRDRPWLQ